MDARALTCPQCGAAAESDATSCRFCRVRLATVACSSCFGLVFVGNRHCGHCGAALTSPGAAAETPHPCPRGCGALRSLRLGGIELEECETCVGMWVRQAVLMRLFAEEERGAVTVGPAVLAHQVQRGPVETVRYVPCPECRKVMNRINFAKRSGVVLDSCAAHGTWFDADELRRVVEFIRSGGVDKVRTRERMYLDEERRSLEFKQRLGDPAGHGVMSHDDAGSTLRTSALEYMLFLFGER